jgi:15-cis-phytoene synthase
MPEITNSLSSLTDQLLTDGHSPELNKTAEYSFKTGQAFSYNRNKNEWSEYQWDQFNNLLRTKALLSGSEENAWNILARGARNVMRNYTTSFYIVTRFLPFKKRQQVEAIYAAVRYPDEIVDTFEISPSEKNSRIDQWADWYENALQGGTIKEQLQRGVPPFIVSFVHVVCENNIPVDHYRAFLNAMRLDVKSPVYNSMGDLIDSYIYGSAIVVGYFLAYVYGSRTPNDFNRTLIASRDLGIALQLTNFMRDVQDDQKRGRVYIPFDMLQKADIELTEVINESPYGTLKPLVNEILEKADVYYKNAQSNIDAFSGDCRTAIQACIDVYRQLNRQIRDHQNTIVIRQSVSLAQKFRVLPPSKYWRVPAAYLLKI